jgi:uncharacterized membrane protein YccF (DUF307 family)
VAVYLLAAIGCVAIIIVPLGRSCFRRNAAALSAMAASNAAAAPAAGADVIVDAAPGGDPRIAQIISEIPQRRVRRHA